jgi:hypothetical protein
MMGHGCLITIHLHGKMLKQIKLTCQEEVVEWLEEGLHWKMFLRYNQTEDHHLFSRNGGQLVWRGRDLVAEVVFLWQNRKVQSTKVLVIFLLKTSEMLGRRQAI